MLTIFSTPKPFRDPHIALIQTNAIRSWAQLGCEVLLFGAGDGTAELARDLGIRHLPDVQTNEFGTPLVSAMFRTAERLSTRPVICFANADILFLRDLLAAAQVLRARGSALLIGRRTDLDVTERVRFEAPDWEDRLRDAISAKGRLHDQGGIDYFVFRRGVLGELPPLAVGRAGWDMYMLYHARAMGADLIDATEVVTAIHQNHDYAHHPQGRKWVFDGPESRRNVELAGGRDHLFDPRDATHRLCKEGVLPVVQPFRRRLRKFAVLHPRVGWPLRSARRFLRLLRASGSPGR